MLRRTTAPAALVAAAALVLAVSLGTGCARSRLAAEDLSPEQKAALVIKPGQSRSSVEAVLGMPTAIGPAKGGNVYAQYQSGQVIRSVVYDSGDRVVAAYP